ncbi:hypothetical protein B0T16DRAFT_494887 [Cercophora newfieldiana]|uniref:Rhodopsin domain-containing protein n=1 Tax=Cercophora newfieldiana TaxID=92897 RepID=A0AA39Y0X3_9PEZI|nr:hypothetical protein B0T16DRAFT_494887 [Cercophora newfieldiana]
MSEIPEIDQLSVGRKREHVIAAIVVGLVLSTLSTVLRVWARVIVINRLKREDWIMIAGLVFSYGALASLLYGLAVGFAEPFDPTDPVRRKGYLLSIWIVQKIQPITLLIIKTSILIFNASIFQTRPFAHMAWGVWIFTLGWTIAAVFGTVFQCKPLSFFWDKMQDGTCSMRTLQIIGLSTSVASSAGDIFIMLMPIPFLLKLKVSMRRRIGLLVVFTVGLFAITASFIRWTTLLSALSKSALFSAQHINVTIWTYLEMSIGITCGNLPFLATLWGRLPWKRGNSGSNGSHGSANPSRLLPKSWSSNRGGAASQADTTKDMEFAVQCDDSERGTIDLRATQPSFV